MIDVLAAIVSVHRLELVGALAQGIFLFSYAHFALHIHKVRDARGVSGLAVLGWLVAYAMLAIYFYLKWTPAFFAYYVLGIALSLWTLALWKNYR